jgi:hypothetical protein
VSLGPVAARKRTVTGDEWVFLYEWFAGWRWEHHRDGRLQDEGLESYATVRECVANAGTRGYRSPRIRRGRAPVKRIPRPAARPIGEVSANQPGAAA